MPDFNEVYGLLYRKGSATVISSIGTKYTVTAHNGKILAISEGGGRIYIHDDCWGNDKTCKGTRAGGIYNGSPSIFDWFAMNNSDGEIDADSLTWSEEVPFTKENIARFNESGVFLLRDSDGNNIYVGNASYRPISKRLAHFFSHNEGECSLRKTLKTDENMNDAEIDAFFASLRVSVIYGHEHLKAYYIKNVNPRYNKTDK